MSSFDLSGIKSPKGLLKLFQALINLIGAIFCFASDITWMSPGNFFEFVAMTGFILDLLLLAMAFVKISSQFKCFAFFEMVLDGLWILFYLIAANIIIKFVSWDGKLGVSVFCGYIAMITYFIDALITYKISRSPTISTQSDGGAWTTERPRY